MSSERACTADPNVLAGRWVSAQAYPAGSRYTLSAPRSTAREIPPVVANPPSQSTVPSSSTAGNTAGMAALASTAGTTSPVDRHTCSPVSTSVVIRWSGMAAF